MKNLTITLILSIYAFFSHAQSMDDKIKTLANEIADQVAKNGKKTVAVATLTYNDSDTQFGKLLAEKISGKIAVSGRGITVVNQKMLAELLKQNKLTTGGILTAKSDAAKLGQASGIDALAYGIISSFGEEIQLTVNIVELKTTNVFGNAEVSFPLTTAVKNMLIPINSSPENPTTLPPENMPSDCKTKNICTVCVTNQTGQDIVTILYNRKRTNKEILINPNSTECWKEVAINPDSDFEDMRWIVKKDGRIISNEVLAVEACKTYKKTVNK